jgi:hypothetical protein
LFLGLDGPTAVGVPRRVGSLGLSVDVSTMSDLDDGDSMEAVVHLKKDSEIPLPKPKPVLSDQFFTSLWPRFHGEVLNLSDDAAPVLGLEGLQLFDRRGFDAELIVCHGVSDL